MTLNELIELKYQIELEVGDLTVWLKQKESIEYANYLANGGNERTAKEKVIDSIKMADETDWMEKEEDLRKLKVKLAYYNDCIQVVKPLIVADYNASVEFMKLIEEK